MAGGKPCVFCREVPRTDDLERTKFSNLIWVAKSDVAHL